MGTDVLLKFSFEMFLGRLNLAIVENAHAYCVQIMKIIMSGMCQVEHIVSVLLRNFGWPYGACLYSS
jgi:hypothetical protein